MIPRDPDWLRTILPVPYLWRGRDLTGWDCFGLVDWVETNVFGLEVPDLCADYGDDDWTDSVTARWELQADLIEKNRVTWRPVEPCTGAVVLIRIGRFPAHVGVDCGGGRFVHCLRGPGTHWSRYNDREWKDRVEGFFLPS